MVQPAEPIRDYLESHIGSDRRIIEQVYERRTPNGVKYVERGEIEPDIDAYLQGRGGVWGSRPRLPGGLTRILKFDNDAGVDMRTAARKLQAAGLYPIHALRRERRSHLTIWFDSPVSAEAARALALAVAPELQACEEVYPCKGTKDCAVQGVGWGLLRLKEVNGKQTVIACPIEFYGRNGTLYCDAGVIAEPDTVRQGLLECLTPASLIAQGAETTAKPPIAPPLSGNAVHHRRRVYSRDRDSNPSEKHAAIDWWNANPRNQAEVDVLVAACPNQGGYVSVRPSDKTPSTRRDRDNYYKRTWWDFGERKKLDDFELYCRLKGLDKGREGEKVLAEYRVAQGK